MISVVLVGADRIQAVLKKARNIDKLASLWMETGEPDEIMHKSFEQNFSEEGRPAWDELSDLTIQIRENEGFGDGPILQRTGNLKDEIVTMKGQTSGGVGSAMMEWGINQLRGVEQQKFAKHQAGGSNDIDGFGPIPARPMVGFQEQDSRSMLMALSKFLRNSLK